MVEGILAAVSPRGLESARRLRQALGAGSVVPLEGDPEAGLQRLLRQGRPLVCFVPAEAVVRALAPLLAAGQTVPPVLWCDDEGNHVLGLAGDTAAWARKVASALKAKGLGQSGMRGLEGPDVHLIGRKWGWRLENAAALPRVVEAVRSGQRVAVFQDAGQRDWWQPFGSWPHHFERLSAWPCEGPWSAVLVISDRGLPYRPWPLADRAVIFRPQTLTLGVACRRGVTAEQLRTCCEQLFAQHGLSLLSLAAVGTSAIHRHEVGLAAFAEQCEVPLLPYAADKLALVGPPGRLTVAQACEAAAMLSAGVTVLTVPKTTFRCATLAVARRPVR
jgi:cobalt-precorrin 5A hydrolase